MNNEIIVEQSEVEFVADNKNTAESSCPQGSSDDSTTYGNFANADELYRGYKNLHAEFTRKSQELKRLETDIGNSTSASVASEEVVEETKVEKTSDDIIREYLFGVKKGKVPPVVIGATQASIPITSGVKTLRDADKLAKDFFNSRR